MVSKGAPARSVSRPASSAVDAARAHRLPGTVQGDARRAHHPVKTGRLQLWCLQSEQPVGEVVAELRHRLVAGEPQPLDVLDRTPLGQRQGGSDTGLGREGVVAQYPGGGPLAGGEQVVIQAAEFERALDLAVHHLGTDATAAHQQPLVHQQLDGLADGGAGEPQAPRELYLVAQQAAGDKPAALDGRLQLLGELEVERDRAGAVHTELQAEGEVGHGF